MYVLSAFASDFPPPTRSLLSEDAPLAPRETDNKSRASDAAAAYGCVDWFLYPDSQPNLLVATVPV